MKNSVLKTIVVGALMGTLFFFMPFFVLGMFICFGIFGMMMRRRMRYGFYHFAMADKIRQMSEEEYQNFKAKMSYHSCYSQHQNPQNVQP